jgi:polyhydroxybutyrate depolymerase
MRTPRAVAICIFTAIVLAACSSSSKAAVAPPTTATRVTAATTTTLPPATKPLAAQGPAYVYHLEFDGRARGYRLHVPPAAASGKPLPLVLNLHGDTQNGELEELQTGMDSSSDRDGYLVAYPDGTRIATKLSPDPVAKNAQYGWDAGNCCGLPATLHVNDVGFLLAVISNAAAHTPVDLRRVYVTGMSSGGMMAYAMAAQAADHIAAIASSEGSVALPSIHPSRPVPTLEYHSVNDPIVKWSNVMPGIDQWVKADGCNPKPHDGATIHGTPTANSGLTATLVTYGSCRGGAEVRLWRFTGSGHVWPGAPFNTGPRSTWILDGVGRGTTLVNGNEDMWKFFRQHELPA